MNLKFMHSILDSTLSFINLCFSKHCSKTPPRFLQTYFNTVCGRFHIFKAFYRECDGVSAIQFAILAPVFILGVVTATQIGIVLIVENALEGAAREASRFALVDANQDVQTVILYKVAHTANKLSAGIVKINNIEINIRSYKKLSDMGRPEPFEDTNGNGVYEVGELYDDINENGQWDEDRGVSGSFGKPGAAVVYEIVYEYDTVIPIFNFDPKVKIKARTIVVNEEYEVRPPSNTATETGGSVSGNLGDLLNEATEEAVAAAQAAVGSMPQSNLVIGNQSGDTSQSGDGTGTGTGTGTDD